MTSSPQKTLLCVTSYEKGQEFIRECKRQGAYVILLTVTALENANWPRESIDELYYMPDLSKSDEVIRAVSFLARTRVIDSIVALDDYDVWTAANLREHLRIPGMGDTTVRHFRDKLAMRLQAQENNIPVPDFVHVLNYDKVSEFIDRVPQPWVLKPRAEASTIASLWKTSAQRISRRWHIYHSHHSPWIYGRNNSERTESSNHERIWTCARRNPYRIHQRPRRRQLLLSRNRRARGWRQHR